MGRTDNAKLPVTDDLREKVEAIYDELKADGKGWPAFPEAVEGWPASWGLAYQIARGQATTDRQVYEALDIEPPTFIEVALRADSVLFGDVGLIDAKSVVAVLVLHPEEWARHSIECEVCGEETPRWSPAQKYCPAHSWATEAGRRYWREQKAKQRGGER